jgi:hypothetical protein
MSIVSSFLVAKDSRMRFAIVNIRVYKPCFEVDSYAIKAACEQSLD